VSARWRESVAGPAPWCSRTRRLALGSVDLADKRVKIDDQPLGAGAGAGRPCAGDELAEDAVELADMPELNARKNVPSVDGASTR
jgi:hypothetical protein